MAARPARRRPLDAAHDRRDAAADAVLPRPRAAARAADLHVAEVLPDARHRRRRARRPSPDLLRDARQLLVRAVLQEGRDRVRDRLHPEPPRARLGSHLGDRPRGRPHLPARARRGRDQGVGGDRDAVGADRRAPELGELLVGRRAGPVRSRLGDLLGLGAGARLRRSHVCACVPALRPLPRVLEPRLHGVRAAPGRDADAAAEAEHRHGHGARAAVGDRPERARAVRLRDRRLPDDHGLGGEGERRRVRRVRAGDEGASHPGRPRARDDVPRRRRRQALERRTRLRAAGG